MKKTCIKFAIHGDNESPIFGDDTLHITADSHGSGSFVVIENVNPSDMDLVGDGKITLEVKEIEMILEIAREFEQIEKGEK